jgi:hypothetical protein
MPPDRWPGVGLPSTNEWALHIYEIKIENKEENSGKIRGRRKLNLEKYLLLTFLPILHGV